MKKLFFILILSSIAIFVSCERNSIDPLEDLKDQLLTFEEFFDIASNKEIKLSEENVIYIRYEWHKKDHLVKYIGSEEKEPDFFILLPPEEDIAYRGKKNKYKVSCDNGDDSWNKGCNGTISCGKLMKKCLDAGGCAEICKKQMIYVPQEKYFIIINDKEFEK